MQDSATKVNLLGVIKGEISGSRNVGRRDHAGRRLREVFVVITEDDSEHLAYGDHIALRKTH